MFVQGRDDMSVAIHQIKRCAACAHATRLVTMKRCEPRHGKREYDSPLSKILFFFSYVCFPVDRCVDVRARARACVHVRMCKT